MEPGAEDDQSMQECADGRWLRWVDALRTIGGGIGCEVTHSLAVGQWS